jgi:hypothetical protein
LPLGQRPDDGAAGAGDLVAAAHDLATDPDSAETSLSGCVTERVEDADRPVEAVLAEHDGARDRERHAHADAASVMRAPHVGACEVPRED